jgi:RimJ/RimL family protein N-acetyltransferase
MTKMISWSEQIPIPGGTAKLRPEQPQDAEFLRALFYSAACLPEGMPPGTAEALLDMQHRGQVASYRVAYPQACYLIIMRAGSPCGRLIYNRGAPSCIVDYTLLPDCRGTGIGTAVLRAVLAGRGVPVRATVLASNNASLAMCRRLGFTVLVADPVHLTLEWRPPA